MLGLVLGWPLTALLGHIVEPGTASLFLGAQRRTDLNFGLASQWDWHIPIVALLAASATTLAAWPAVHGALRCQRRWAMLLVLGVVLPILAHLTWLMVGFAIAAIGQFIQPDTSKLAVWLVFVRPLAMAALPFQAVIIMVGLGRRDPSLTRAATSLGAGPWLRLRLLYWPQAWPWLLAAWLLGAVIVGAQTIWYFARLVPVYWLERLAGLGFPDVPDTTHPEIWLGFWAVLIGICLVAYGWLTRTPASP